MACGCWLKLVNQRHSLIERDSTYPPCLRRIAATRVGHPECATSYWLRRYISATCLVISPGLAPAKFVIAMTVN